MSTVLTSKNCIFLVLEQTSRHHCQRSRDRLFETNGCGAGSDRLQSLIYVPERDFWVRQTTSASMSRCKSRPQQPPCSDARKERSVFEFPPSRFLSLNASPPPPIGAISEKMSPSSATRLLLTLGLLMASGARIQAAPRVHHDRMAANGCDMAVQPIPGMNPIVRVDENGRSCRGNITTQVCLGFCETHEDVTHKFPFRIHTSLMCAHSSTELEEITLTECDDGAASHIRKVKILRATGCVCQKCNPKTMHCSDHYFNFGRK